MRRSFPVGSADPAAWKQAGASELQIKQLRLANRSFAQAMNLWNGHAWPAAVQLFKQHVETFPNSPWAGEALMRLGDDAKYHGRLSEAQSYYDHIVKNTSDAASSPGYEVAQKAKMRWAGLDIVLGNYEGAHTKLQNILRTERHWRRLTWARHWTQQINLYQKARNSRNLVACGTRALAVVLASAGEKAAAQRVNQMEAPRKTGFSLAELATIGQRNGLTLRGFRVPAPQAGPVAGRLNGQRVRQLAALPLPLILFCRTRAEARPPLARVPAQATTQFVTVSGSGGSKKALL